MPAGVPEHRGAPRPGQSLRHELVIILMADLDVPADSQEGEVLRYFNLDTTRDPQAMLSQKSSDITLVGEGGLEPPHPFGYRPLKPARLPISPLALRPCNNSPTPEPLCSQSLGSWSDRYS